LKDDTLGLGARPKRDLLDEPTGLDAFKGLLGRLNGKSDTQLEAEQQKRNDVKLARYAATKWQTVRFISGGLLVQEKDNATALPASQDLRVDFPRKTSSHESENGLVKMEPRDRDSRQEDCATTKEQEEEKKKKKKKKGKELDMSSRKTREKKQEKRQKKRKISDYDGLDAETADNLSTKVLLSVANDKGTCAAASNSPSTSRERQPMGRRIFRSRHIEQKKKALMDDKSLNEVFIILAYQQSFSMFHRS
jgi:Pin2-interacting protein X1